MKSFVIFILLISVNFCNAQIVHSFTCCTKSNSIPDNITLTEVQTELIVTPSEGIQFEAITDETISLKIFGRWGNKLLDVRNPGQNFKWDGRKEDGQMLPEGTYYYIIQQSENVGREDGELKGFITLLN